MNGLKIYEIAYEDGNKDWIAARTTIEALIVHNNFTDMWVTDFEQGDDILEVPQHKWKDITIVGDKESITAEEYMKTCIEPTFIASTNF